MTRIPEHLWPVREPSCDFVGSTVERMLAMSNVPQRRRLPVRQVAWLFAAALLATGVAFGLIHAGSGRSPAVRVPQVTSPVLAPPKPTLSNTVTTPVEPSATPAVKPQSKVKSPRKASPAKPKPTAEASSPVPRVPPCGCERGFGDYICDCY